MGSVFEYFKVWRHCYHSVSFTAVRLFKTIYFNSHYAFGKKKMKGYNNMFTKYYYFYFNLSLLFNTNIKDTNERVLKSSIYIY